MGKAEFAKFDDTVGRLLSVPHEELKRREKQYQARRKKKKRAKPSPASHGPASSS